MEDSHSSANELASDLLAFVSFESMLTADAESTGLAVRLELLAQP